MNIVQILLLVLLILGFVLMMLRKPRLLFDVAVLVALVVLILGLFVR